VAYIGACTGAKYEDLKGRAAILRGRKLAPGVELARRAGFEARPGPRRGRRHHGGLRGGRRAILPNACGICAGYGADRLGEDVTCISSTARNFKGRMGAASSKVWLGSPLTVAASAITGRIADPRDFLKDGEGAA
jgi:3-isopropylmalate/(R)-2-methylmalate dehydratase large subunit